MHILLTRRNSVLIGNVSAYLNESDFMHSVILRWTINLIKNDKIRKEIVLIFKLAKK